MGGFFIVKSVQVAAFARMCWLRGSARSAGRSIGIRIQFRVQMPSTTVEGLFHLGALSAYNQKQTNENASLIKLHGEGDRGWCPDYAYWSRVVEI